MAMAITLLILILGNTSTPILAIRTKSLREDKEHASVYDTYTLFLGTICKSTTQNRGMKSQEAKITCESYGEIYPEK